MKKKFIIASVMACAYFVVTTSFVMASSNQKEGVHAAHTAVTVEKKVEKEALPLYDAKKDKAPSEGLSMIVDDHFQFQEPLLVRPKTDMIVIHHVGVPDGDTSAASIHEAHKRNGWAGIGYHYVIRKNGVIERGRPLNTVGAHAYGENYHTVGINVTGNFDKEYPTDNQIQSLVDLLTALCKIYHMEPTSATIVGHRDVNKTDCPGDHLYALLPEIRHDVKVRLFADTLKDTHVLKLKKYEEHDRESVDTK